MSAFHKQTLHCLMVMSALPPKADMCSALAYVRFVPKADIDQKQALILKLGSEWRSVSQQELQPQKWYRESRSR
jgi:hypothetical protein